MVVTGTLFGLALLFSGAFAIPTRDNSHGGPPQGNPMKGNSTGIPCSTNSGANCVCPAGLDYAESVTWVVVGTHVSNVAELMNDFQAPAWRGSSPYAVEGPNNRPGVSKRTSTYKTLMGTFNFTEVLTSRSIKRDGSFVQKLEYAGAVGNSTGNPWETPSGPGGYWITIGADYIFGDSTMVYWATYLCSRGVVNGKSALAASASSDKANLVMCADWAKLHEASFNNVTNVLKPKTIGINYAPFSIPPKFS